MILIIMVWRKEYTQIYVYLEKSFLVRTQRFVSVFWGPARSGDLTPSYNPNPM
jgi:hypothetical protein